MTLPSLPTRWGKILILVGLTFGLTATLVKGAGTEPCGANSLCGYGSICDTKTSQCVCLSGKDGLRMREGNPFSTFYCLGKGVTECGDQLCGYRAECNTDNRRCGCSSRTGVLTELTGTFPSLWYCLESCSSDSPCNDNTRCTDPYNTSRYRCTCLPGTTLSPTGQCLGGNTTTVWTSTANVITHTASQAQGGNTTTVWTSTAKVITYTASPAQGGNTTAVWTSTANVITHTASQAQVTMSKSTTPIKEVTRTQGDLDGNSQVLTIVLAAGFGGAILLAVAVFIIVIHFRKRLLRDGERGDSLGAVLQDTHSYYNMPIVQYGHSYENVVNSSLSGERGPRNPGGTGLEQLSIDVPEHDNPNTYENINAPTQQRNDNDTHGLYESANTQDTSDSRLYTTLRQT